MTYPNDLTLVQLAEHYAKFKDESCLRELGRRDKLSTMGYDERMELSLNEEPDNQLVFDFCKQVDSVAETTNNLSVDDNWKNGYETGHRIGFDRGQREGLPGTESKDQRKLIPLGGMHAGGYYEDTKDAKS